VRPSPLSAFYVIGRRRREKQKQTTTTQLVEWLAKMNGQFVYFLFGFDFAFA